MTTLIRTLLVSSFAPILVLAVTSCALPQQETSPSGSIEGTYYVNGVDAGGVEYGGRLEITRGDRPDRYSMQWIITGSVQSGTAIRAGSRIDGDWSTVDGFTGPEGSSSARGTIRYTIASDGSLKGTRTVEGQTGTGTEEAFPVR